MREATMRTETLRKLRGTIAVLALASLALAGCASIPSSGGVKAGENTSTVDDDLFVNYVPSGPVTGASQEAILRGFVEASSSPKDNYEIARQFLAPAFSGDWKPSQNVIVDDRTGRVYSQLSDSTMQLAINPIATVDASGGYREVASSSPVVLQYKFVKTGKGWRISKAPNGTVLDAPTFSDVFSSHAIYFYDPTFAYLVPDLRWFVSSQSTPTTIVKALLAGPAPWLGNQAVVSAFPEGTQLSADSVPINSFRAEVDLNSEANQADPITLGRMEAQLSRSLTGVTGVSRVSVSIEGNAVSVPDLPADSIPTVNPQVDSRPLVYRDGNFGFLTGKELVQLPVSAQVAKLKPRAATVAADQTQAAVLAAGGVYSVGKASERRVDARAGLIAPSLDNAGFVWSVPAHAPAQLIASAPDGTQHAVTTSWPEATSIVSLAVSRDGTRLVALIGTGSESRFVAAAIIRDDHDVPKHLGEPIELATVGGTPLAAAWLDELSVASLSTSASGDTTVVVQRLGGESSLATGPHDGVMIAGAGSLPRYWVLTSRGSIQAGSGTGWQETVSDVSVLATQQGTPG